MHTFIYFTKFCKAIFCEAMFRYSVKLWLFDNRMNSSNQTVVAVPSLL